MNSSKNFIAVLAIALTTLIGCRREQHHSQVIVQGPTTQTAVTATNNLMNAEDFGLSTVQDLIRSNQAPNAESLQEKINDPQTGINNVDLDGDKQVDPITVTETQNGANKHYDFVAHPANKPETTVANMDFITQPNGQVTVQAGYPAYVSGYDQHYYNYSLARDVLFLSWALSPRPLYVSRPYMSYGWYAPRPVYASPVVMQSFRTTTQTTTHVSPIQKTAPPASYKQQAQATKAPTGFAQSTNAKGAPTTGNLNDRGTTKDFSNRDSNKPVQPASGFGAKTASPPTQVAPPVHTSSPVTTTQRSPSPPPRPATPSGPRNSPSPGGRRK